MKHAAPSVLSSMAERLTRLFRKPTQGDFFTLVLMLGIVLAIGAAALVLMLLMARTAHASPLTVGDRVQLVLENGEGFSGKYQVDLQGQIALPYAGPVSVAGLDTHRAALAVTQQLEARGLFRAGAARTTLQVLWWAP